MQSYIKRWHQEEYILLLHPPVLSVTPRTGDCLCCIFSFNMKLASLFLVFQIAGVAIAAATPRSWPMIASSEAENSDLQKRQQIDNYYITLCENKDYTGRCARIQAAWDICCRLIHSTRRCCYWLLQDSIIQENNEWASSAKSDAGGKCVLYEYVLNPLYKIIFNLVNSNNRIGISVVQEVL